MGAQPIDTCPKDGSEFLAYDPEARKFDVCTWIAPGIYGAGGVTVTQLDGEYGPLDDEFRADRSTIWWPLPSV